jgi:hypothetical protein
MFRTMLLALSLLLVAAWSPSCNEPSPPAPVPPPQPGPTAVADAGKPPAPVPTPTPPPVPPPVGDVYDDACAALAAIPCAEGKSKNCAVSMRQADKAHLTKINPGCLASARTKAQAVSCGFVKCAQ